MFGLTFEKLLLVALVAVCLIGPTRLPAAAAQLGRWTRRARELVSVARTRVRDEMGPDFDDIDWKSLDPRQYDPRQIVRQALIAPTVVEAPPATPEELAAVPGYVPAVADAVTADAPAPAPGDSEPAPPGPPGSDVPVALDAAPERPTS